MEALWLMFLASTVILPVTALWALRWAMQHDEFKNIEKTALTIFDEEEPVDEVTDYFPGHRPPPRGKDGPSSRLDPEEPRGRQVRDTTSPSA